MEMGSGFVLVWFRINCLLIVTSCVCRGAQETHETAKRKIQQMDRLRDALGLGDVKEGEAFDRELQVNHKPKRCNLH